MYSQFLNWNDDNPCWCLVEFCSSLPPVFFCLKKTTLYTKLITCLDKNMSSWSAYMKNYSFHNEIRCLFTSYSYPCYQFLYKVALSIIIKPICLGNWSFRTKDFSHKSFSTSFGPFAQFLVVILHNNHKWETSI